MLWMQFLSPDVLLPVLVICLAAICLVRATGREREQRAARLLRQRVRLSARRRTAHAAG